MSRPKGSKNKSKEVELPKVQKSIPATPSKEQEKLKIFLYNMDTLTSEPKDKIGLSVSYANQEFVIFVSNADKKFEIACHTSGILSDAARIKLLKKEEFKIKLSPSSFKKLIEYIQATPVDKIERSLRAIKREIGKEE